MAAKKEPIDIEEYRALLKELDYFDLEAFEENVKESVVALQPQGKQKRSKKETEEDRGDLGGLLLLTLPVFPGQRLQVPNLVFGASVKPEPQTEEEWEELREWSKKRRKKYEELRNLPAPSEEREADNLLLLAETTHTISEKTVLDYLCPALSSLSDDVFDIAKVTTPVLLTLAFTGVIAIPIQPTLFAAVAIVISRMGIATLCADYEEEDEDKD